MDGNLEKVGRRAWDARRLLEAWGLRISGGSLMDPVRRTGGGEKGLDDELAAARYVEGTVGFLVARPVLVHVHAKGQPAGTYPLAEVGTSARGAALRLGWGRYLVRPDGAGRALECVPGVVYREFVGALAERLGREPFVPPSELAELADPLDEGMVRNVVTPAERNRRWNDTRRVG